MITHKEKFSEVYRTNLKRATVEQPEQYGFIIGNEDTVADKMLVAIDLGSYNKDGYAFKATCKELGIKHTYAAINAFWKS